MVSQKINQLFKFFDNICLLLPICQYANMQIYCLFFKTETETETEPKPKKMVKTETETETGPKKQNRTALLSSPGKPCRHWKYEIFPALWWHHGLLQSQVC